MPLDPRAKAYLDDLASRNIPSLEEMTIDEIRENTRAESATLGMPEPVGRIEDMAVPRLGAEADGGGTIPIRIYAPDTEGPPGVFVFYHGGGWVMCDISTHEAICRRLAGAAGCAVVSVGYRLAPENKYPAAVNDAYAATRWVFENAGLLGVDPGLIAIGGDSAGGNLAAAVAQMCRDRGDPWPVMQVLVYPVIDYSFDTPSYHENAEGYLLTRDSMKWLWDCYLECEEDGARPYASPIRAQDLSGLAPALIQTAQYDPLRDEGEDYARRLQEAGVAVTLTRYDGMIHGFFRRGIMFDQAHVAVREVADALRKAFSRLA